MPQESEKDLLQRIPGIGPAKSGELVDEFGDSPRGALGEITTASTSSFDNIDGISRDAGRQLQRDMRRYDIDRGVYDADPREREAETKGEFSDAVGSAMPSVDTEPSEATGFTEVQDTDFTRTEEKRAQKFHQARSERAQAIDESLRAPIADSFDQWRNDKAGYDFPGVDTPSGGLFDDL